MPITAPDWFFQDGFDKYTSSGYNVLVTGVPHEWTGSSVGGGSLQFLGTPYGSPDGGSFYSAAASDDYIWKTFPAVNYVRSIGGCYFFWTNTTRTGGGYIGFMDMTTGSPVAQFTITHNMTSGRFEARRGGPTGTVIATSAFVLAQITEVSIEWDIVFHNSTGVIRIYFNGVIDANFNLTGQDTCATANNQVGMLRLGATANATGPSARFDHFFIGMYLAAGGGDSAFLTSPIIETDFVSGDNAVASTEQRSVLGQYYLTTSGGGTSGTGTGGMILGRTYVPLVNCDLDSVSLKSSTLASANRYKSVVYSLSGTTFTLVDSGIELTGFVGGAWVTSAFSSPVALTAGVTYLVGIMIESIPVNGQVTTTDGSVSGFKWGNTYGAGTAPATLASGSGAGWSSWQIVGNISNGAAKYAALSILPPQREYSYVYEATVNDRDTYDVPAFPIQPALVYNVAVKALGGKTDGGARTVNLEIKSASAYGAGSAGTFTPPVGFTSWMASYFWTDPNTSSAWSAANASASKIGTKVIS